MTKISSYNVENETVLNTAEPAVAYVPQTRYRHPVVNLPSLPNETKEKVGRMSVEEYFGIVRSVLHRKYESLQD